LDWIESQAFFLVIPSKKWLLGLNLIQKGIFQGFSDNTQGTGCGQGSNGNLQTLTGPF